MRTAKGRDYIREIVKETRSAQVLANLEQGRCNQGGGAGFRGILLPPLGEQDHPMGQPRAFYYPRLEACLVYVPAAVDGVCSVPWLQSEAAPAFHLTLLLMGSKS